MKSAVLLSMLLAALASVQPAEGSPTPAPTLQSPTTPEQVLLPQGTLVVVRTRHGINSYGVQAGVKVTYEVVQDVVVNGYLFAKAGDVAEGTIQSAQAGENSLFNTKAANLGVSIDTLYNFCGDKIDIDFIRSEYRRRQGFMGSHKDVEIIKGQMYQAPTEHPQKVCAEKTTELPLPIPSGALPGDNN